ncbi:MAG: S9 family peptidase [Elusimicrobiales bacterium]|nr:S9 family peptidase [Elusimicrobiales bacterium]
MNPPIAFKKPFKMEVHGDIRIDDYYWMRERGTKEVIKYLKDENKYTSYIMKDYRNIQKSFFIELKSMIKDDDQTAKVKYKNYLYFKKYLKGKDYPIYYRERISDKKVEKIVDINKIAKGKKYCHVPEIQISPDESFAIFATDFVGRRFYSIYIIDLNKSKKTFYKLLDNTSSNFVWGRDSKTIYYVKQDSQTLRWKDVYEYDLENKRSRLIYSEEDPTYSVYISKSLSEKYIFINSQSTLTTEVRYIDLENGDLKLFKKREKGLEYYVEDGGEFFFIKHNKDAKNFKISVIAKNSDTHDINKWLDFIPHRDNVFIDDYDVLKDFIAVFERKDALLSLRIISKDKKYDKYVSFQDDVYVISPGTNLEYDSKFYRYEYESPVNPPSIYDYDITNSKSILIKTKEYPNYDSSKYFVKRIWADSRDGKKISITFVGKKDMNPDNLLIYGYGSYGYSIDPIFNFTIFPLINSGFGYAIAHVRGGGELGRDWYDDGRLLNKKNTFNDFIDVTLYLKKLGYGSNSIFAEGGSAGGLLMGAIANMAPELYTGIIAQVPFVDCLTTMLDETIPLTTSEYDEWGDPKIKEHYYYIKSYSPYDNVSKKKYPNLLITAGYHDSQVQYWEPAKWTAKLRQNNTSNSIILLKTDMSSGHWGKIGRYKSLYDIAFNYSFILRVLEKKK